MTTQDAAGLVKHLRAEAVLYEQAGCPYVVRNLREAASALESQAAEIARLAEVLRKIARYGDPSTERVMEVVQRYGLTAPDSGPYIARAALGNTPADLDRQGPR